METQGGSTRKLEYKVMDKVLLSFILAPRVEND